MTEFSSLAEILL